MTKEETRNFQIQAQKKDIEGLERKVASLKLELEMQTAELTSKIEKKDKELGIQANIIEALMNKEKELKKDLHAKDMAIKQEQQKERSLKEQIKKQDFQLASKEETE